ncbi:NnrS family protein [Maritimibacter sp. 55A14]|nr:NnrS family protein [Maritimibacter sp. 55A14]
MSLPPASAPRFTRLRLVLGSGFRVFFLGAAIYAIVSMLAWSAWIAGQASGGGWPGFAVAPLPQHWHAHEMIFGYAGAVLGGFFLTAVPSWTGTPEARARFVAAAAAIWLAGRIALWFSGLLDPVLVAVADLAFLPILGLKIAVQLAKRPKPQNVMLLGLLAIVWGGNLMTHLEWTGVLENGAAPGLRMGLLGVAAVIAVVGGRVTPAFTRNALRASGEETRLPVSRRPVEAAAVAAVILTPLLAGAGAPGWLAGAAALIAGAALALRLAGWRGALVLDRPILWSLHLGFGMLAAGYLALGLAWLGLLPESAALHLLGIGAVGGMTVAVMSRASLGHTGRALVAPRPVAWAYGLVAGSAILRVAASWGGAGWYFGALGGAALLWLLAFGLFLLALAPVLTRPRL